MRSEARKYKLNVTLGMQYRAQVETRVRGSFAGNVGNLVVFRIGAKGAAILGREFTPTFSAENPAASFGA